MRNYLKFILMIVAVALFFVLFFHQVNFAQVLDSLTAINPLYILVFAFGMAAQFLVRAYRWGILLSPYKRNIPLKTLFNFTVIGFFLNTIVPGKLGEPGRAILISHKENIKKSSGLASVLVERLIDILVILVIFLISLLFMKNSQSQFLIKLRHISYWALPLLILVFVSFYLLNIDRFFLLFQRLIRFLLRVLPLRFRNRVEVFIFDFVKSLKLNLDLVSFLNLAWSSLLIWIIQIPFYWILLKAFSIGINIIETVPFFAVIVAGASIPTPGMAGSLDAASKLALTQLYAVPAAKAVAFTLLFHFVLLILTFFLGLVCLWLEGLNVNKIKGYMVKNEMSGL